MNNPELPLDPNLQTSNLLITFLKYASIVMQDTKGLSALASLQPFGMNCRYFRAFSTGCFSSLSRCALFCKPCHKTPLTMVIICPSLFLLRWASAQQRQTVPDHPHLHSRGGTQHVSQHTLRVVLFGGEGFGHFLHASSLCLLTGSVRRCFPARWQHELQSQSSQNGESGIVCRGMSERPYGKHLKWQQPSVGYFRTQKYQLLLLIQLVLFLFLMVKLFITFGC